MGGDEKGRMFWGLYKRVLQYEGFGDLSQKNWEV